MTAQSTAADDRSPGLPVDRIRPAYEQVADQLREHILSRRLLPGDRLPVETKLVSAFGVSRSTVREALRSLSAQNLVYTSRGVSGGTFIANTTPGVIASHIENGLSLLSGANTITSEELLEARELLEVPATRLAAKRRTQEHLDQMRSAIEPEMNAPDRGGKFQHNSQFHALVLDAAANRLLAVMTAPVFRVIQARFLNDDTDPRFWRQVDEDHAAILCYIENRDADAAAEAMRCHLVRLRGTYREKDADRASFYENN